MDLVINNKISIIERVLFFILLLMALGSQILIVKTFPQYAILFLILSISFLMLVIFYVEYLRNLFVFLLILNFLPLVILNNPFHYELKLELLSYLPIYFFIILATCIYFLTEKKLIIEIKYLHFPIILLLIFYGIIAIYSLALGRGLFMVSVEYFHFALYLLIIPFYYLINDRWSYLVILKFLFFIAILISIEYIVYSQIIYNGRFVTFQSGFLPLAVGVSFAFFLFEKKILKKILLALIFNFNIGWDLGNAYQNCLDYCIISSLLYVFYLPHFPT